MTDLGRLIDDLLGYVAAWAEVRFYSGEWNGDAARHESSPSRGTGLRAAGGNLACGGSAGPVDLLAREAPTDRRALGLPIRAGKLG